MNLAKLATSKKSVKTGNVNYRINVSGEAKGEAKKVKAERKSLNALIKDTLEYSTKYFPFLEPFKTNEEFRKATIKNIVAMLKTLESDKRAKTGKDKAVLTPNQKTDCIAEYFTTLLLKASEVDISKVMPSETT